MITTDSLVSMRAMLSSQCGNEIALQIVSGFASMRIVGTLSRIHAYDGWIVTDGMSNSVSFSLSDKAVMEQMPSQLKGHVIIKITQ